MGSETCLEVGVRYVDVERGVSEAANRGDLPDRVVEAVRQRRVVEVSDEGGSRVYVFLGRSGDYLVVPGTFCSCRDFEFNVMFRWRRRACYHLVATELAIRRGLLRRLKVGRDTFLDILYEVVFNGRSRILRKLATLNP